MAKYSYTGRLTDFSETPFPGAIPELVVRPEREAFGTTGLLASRDIRVTVDSTGTFSVDLVASVDMSPASGYVLVCNWLDAGGVARGWSEWKFNAVIGGGPIKDSVSAPASVWIVGPPWPAEPIKGAFYFDKFTNDVGRA